MQGGNGQGKTSLLRLITGLGRPDSGEVRWRGEPISRCRETYHREMAYLGHANGIKDDLNPLENLRFDQGLRQPGFRYRPSVATLKRLGLSRCLDLPCRALSFGQRRRVALSALLLAGARLWILDRTPHRAGRARRGPGGEPDPRPPASGRSGGGHHAPTMNLEGVSVQHLLVGEALVPAHASVEVA